MGDLEKQALGALDQLVRLALAVMDRLLDSLRGREQPPKKRVLLDDLRVVPGVARDRDGGGELGDGFLAARLGELAVLCQVLGDGQRVDRLPLLVKARDRAEDDAVPLAVEVLVVQADIQDHRGDRALGDHHRTENGSFCLEVLGRDVGLGGGHGGIAIVRVGAHTLR